MHIEGTFVVSAPRAVVWALLNDAAVLARALPGCERFVQSGQMTFDAVLKAGIASIRGVFSGSVRVEAPNPPHSYELVFDGKGPGGFARGRATIQLADHGAVTAVQVSVDAVVGGAVAAVGQRLLGTAAKMMLGEFFRALDGEARARAAPADPLP